MSEPKADLGQYCTYRDATYSETAKRLGIENVPNAAQLANMQAVHDTIYQPCCEHFGHRLPITSFFRSPVLNPHIPGSSNTSAHCLGQAIDIDCDGLDFVDNLTFLKYVRANYVFDQLILEYPDKDGKPSWVHVAFRTNGKNRKQVLRARYVYVKVKGVLVRKTAYDPI